MVKIEQEFLCFHEAQREMKGWVIELNRYRNKVKEQP